MATSSKPKTSGTTQRRLLAPYNDGPARMVNTEDRNKAQGLKIAQIWIKTKLGKKPASTQREQTLDFLLKFKKDSYNHRCHLPPSLI
jgi:hypothetical protein